MEDGKARGLTISGTCIVRGLVTLPIGPSCGLLEAMVEFYSVKL